jgi:DNA adenine methylase
MRSLIKWHGGKSYDAKRIISYMPPHETYVEVFAGGLSVLLNKDPVKNEVANDINPDLICFWQYVADHGRTMQVLLSRIPYSEAVFKDTFKRQAKNSPIDFLIRNRMSRSALGKEFAWSDRLRGGQPENVNAWETIQQSIPDIQDRIKDVTFLNEHFREVIRRYDSKDTLFYLDPPYFPDTRIAKDIYDYEMNSFDHAELLELAIDCKGMVMLSGYSNYFYSMQLKSWKRIEWTRANHSGQNKIKQSRTEILWIKEWK